MKTQAQIKTAIYELRKQMTYGEIIQADFKKENERLNFLLMYLKTDPTEEALKRQIDAVWNKLTVLENRFDAWLTSNRNLFSNRFQAQSHYEKVNDLTRLKNQVETLEYLLS